MHLLPTTSTLLRQVQSEELTFDGTAQHHILSFHSYLPKRQTAQDGTGKTTFTHVAIFK